MKNFRMLELRTVLGSKSNYWMTAIVVIFLLRILFMGLMGLMPQDAYYEFYGQHLAWSYFDHPPAIAYLLRVFTEVFGERVFAVKMADSVITLLAFIAFYKLCGCFLSVRRSLLACILLFSTLMISTLSLVSTPDVPLILFWTLSLYCLYQAVFQEKKWAWLWSGIMMGLAFDSKYTGVFLPAGLILFLLLSAPHRKLFGSGWFWLGVLMFLVVVTPIIWWNWQHDFASFLFQTSGRVGTARGVSLKVSGFLGLLGHQSAILMPVLFAALLWLVFISFKKYIVRKDPVSPQSLFLYAFFVPVFLLFIFISFVYWVKLNWMMPAYISGIILAARYLNRKWLYYQLGFSLLVHMAIAIEIIFYPLPVQSDDTWFGWDQLSTQVDGLENRYPETFIFSADEYKTSAVLNFYSDSMVYGRNIIGEPALQFDYIGSDLSKLGGRNALFLNSLPHMTSPRAGERYPRRLSAYFDTVTELAPIVIYNGDEPVRKFLVFYCRNYHYPAVRR